MKLGRERRRPRGSISESRCRCLGLSHAQDLERVYTASLTLVLPLRRQRSWVFTLSSQWSSVRAEGCSQGH